MASSPVTQSLGSLMVVSPALPPMTSSLLSVAWLFEGVFDSLMAGSYPLAPRSAQESPGATRRGAGERGLEGGFRGVDVPALPRRSAQQGTGGSFGTEDRQEPGRSGSTARGRGPAVDDGAAQQGRTGSRALGGARAGGGAGHQGGSDREAAARWRCHDGVGQRARGPVRARRHAGTTVVGAGHGRAHPSLHAR